MSILWRHNHLILVEHDLYYLLKSFSTMRRSYIISFVAAIIFSIHILFNNVHSWPLIWPLAGGILAVITGRRHTTYRYSSIVQSGITGGLIVWVICLLAGWFFAKENIIRHYQQFNDPANAEPSVLFGASIVALTYVAAWLFSSGVTTIVTGRKAV
jgi:hypothetical protein